MKIILQLLDEDYQNKRSQVPKEQRMHWPDWYWGKDSNNRLYCKGVISGYSYNEWTRISSIRLPLDERDISILNSLLKI